MIRLSYFVWIGRHGTEAALTEFACTLIRRRKRYYLGTLPNFRVVLICQSIARGAVHEDANSAHLLGLPRACRERPRDHRSTDKRDEIASLHVLPREDHAICSGEILALCDQAASEKWHTTERLFFSRSDVRFGSLADMCAAKAMSALPPIATAKAVSRTRSCLLYSRRRTCAAETVMSALGQ